MIFFIGDEKVELTTKELDSRYINHGEEGFVYQYKKEAVKFFTEKMKYKRRLQEDDVLKLSELNTKRILLPRRPVYDKDKKYIGYTTDFKIEGPKERIGLLKMRYLVKELELIKEDVRFLSDNLVKLQDLNYGGLLMTQDGIFITDPGEYHFSKGSNPNSLYQYNIEEINYFFTRVVLDKYLKLTIKERESLKRLFQLKDDYFLEIIKEHGYNQEQNANRYFKKLCLENINK